ncbi:DUF2164 domain-containing protein [Sporomusa acidovorans]|nr:DUF2164 domain-containing protein [Sporomusa acidovorans]
MVKSRGIELTQEQRKAAVEQIKSYFLTEKEEMVSDLAAMLLLDFFLENIGPYIYNQAIKDAHYFITQKLEDIYALEKPVRQITDPSS